MVKRALLASVALAALTVPAAAEPVSLILAGVNALLGTTFTAGTAILATAGGTAILTVGQVVGGTLALGFAAFSSLLGGGQGRGTIDPGRLKSTFQTESGGRIRCIGRARVGGVVVFPNTTGVNRYRLIAHSAGPIDGVEEHFLGGRSVTVEADGTVSSPPFARPVGSYVYINAKPGDGAETAWPQLTGAFPSLWTADHKVKGIAQSLVIYVSPGQSNPKFLKLYQNGVPEYQRVQRGERLYDPRTGTSAWSDNGVLAVLHALLTYPDIELADFDLPFIAAEADKADQLVPVRGGGTEKRSRAWGVWDEDGIERGDLVRQLMMSTGTELVARPDNKIGIRLIDDAPAYEVRFGQDHIYSMNLKAGPDGVERPNRLRLKYYSPERNYELSEVELVQDRTVVAPQPLAWAYIADEIARVGVKEYEVSLPFCPSAAQAQRIGRRMFAEARADTVQIETTMVGLACWGTKVLAFDPPDIDGPVLMRHQDRVIDDESGVIALSGIVVPSLSAWNPASDEALPPDQIPEFEYESTIATPSAATAASVVTYPGGVIHTRYGYPAPSAAYTVEATYRVITGGIPGAWQSMTEYRSVGGVTHAYVSANLSGQLTEFRHRVFNTEEDGSKWSTTTAFTPAVSNAAPGTPALGTSVGSAAGTPNAISVNFSMTAPASLNVAFLRLAWSLSFGAPGSQDFSCKPGEIVGTVIDFTNSFETDQSVSFSLTAHASDGTASSAAGGGATIPGTGSGGGGGS